MTDPSPPEGEGGARRDSGGRVRGYTGRTLENAKRLRRDLTDAELYLWNVLRAGQLGAKFRRQQPIGLYIADFACHECRLIVELDGGQHNAARDATRTAHLNAAGYRVLRFWNNDVLTNLDGVAATIRAALETPHPPTATQRVPPSPSRGEGIGASHG